MDLTRCQICQEVFDQIQRLPKLLSCGCIQCARCLRNFSQITDTFKCKIHNKKISIQEKNVKDFKIQEYFMQEMNKFEQQSNLIQVIQDLSSQANVHKSKVISIKKEGLHFQKLLNEIVRQVTQILYQNEISDCQGVVVQIEDVLKKMNIINMKYQQIKNIQFQDSQQCNSNLNTLNNLVKEYEGMQNEVQRVRALEYQGSSLNYKIIQEVSFQVFQELMGKNEEQRTLILDYSVMINKYITKQQIIPVQNQPIQLISQPLQQLKIENIQQLQIILDQFKNKQQDVSSILNNPLNTINVCKKQMILYDLIQLKSEKNQQSLLKILNISKNKPQIQQAAANALTMLNYMNFQFTNQDFQNLNLTNCDLSDTTLTNCNFANSNLTQANLRNTKFIKCDLSNANFTSIITEHPHIYTGHSNYVTSISISSDSEFIVSGSYDQTVRLWDVKTGTCKTMSGHTHYVTAVAISRDSELIVSTSADDTMRLWDVKTGTCKTMSGHTDSVYAVAISSDSEFIVSGSRDKTVRLWDVKTGTSKTMSGHTGPVYSISISNDSEFIVSGSDDNLVRLWNTKTQQCIKVLSGHTGDVTSVSISNDQQYIVSGSYDNTIRLWSTKTQEFIKVFSGHSNAVLSVIFSSDNDNIISGSKDKTIKVWNIQSGDCISTICGHTEPVGSLSLSRDGRWLVSSNGNH